MQNVLLSTDHSQAKIGDVGLGKILQSAYTGTASNNVGTLTHAAPEAILGNRCDTKVRLQPGARAAAAGGAPCLQPAALSAPRQRA